MASTSPSSVTSSPSPSRTSAVSSFSREKLEKLFTETVKKLRAKEKELVSVTAERQQLAEKLQAAQSSVDPDEKLADQLQEIQKENATLREQLQSSEAALKALQASSAEAAAENRDLVGQVQGLKTQMRALAEARDAEIEAAVEPVKAEMLAKQQDASRMESMVRAARLAAGKADAHVQVLEGALAATKAKVDQIEEEKSGLEAQVTRLTSDLEGVSATAESARPNATGNQQHGSAVHTEEVASDSASGAEDTAVKETGEDREAQLVLEVQRLTDAAAAREEQVRQKLDAAQAQLDSLLPELEESNRQLAESAAEGAKRVNELGGLLSEREAQILELEERTMNAEAALNTATAALEEREAAISSLQLKLPEASRMDGQTDTEAGEASIEPQLPEISEVAHKTGRAGAELAKERVEELEAYVKRLEDEISSLRNELSANAGAEEESKTVELSEFQSAQARERESAAACTELEKRLEASDAAVADLQEKLAELEVNRQRAAEQEHECIAAKAKVAELEEQVARQQAARESSNVKDEALTASHEDEAGKWAAEKAKLESVKEQLTAELAESKRRFTAAAKRKQAEFSKQAKDLEEEIKTSRNRVQELEAQLAKAQADAAAVSQSQGESQSAELAAANEANRRAQNEATGLREQSEGLKEAAKAAEEARLAAELECKKQTEEASLLRSKVASLETELESLKGQLSSAEEKASAAEKSLQDGTATASQSAQEVAQANEAVEASKSALAKEKERAARFIMDLKKRLEKGAKDLKKAEEATKAAEAEASDLRSKIEAEQNAHLAAKEAAEKLLWKEEEKAAKWESELASYKGRAHALLKSKDAELRAAKDSAEAFTSSQLAEAKEAASKAQAEIIKLQKDLSAAEASASEALQDAEHRHEQIAAELREAAEEAGVAADTASQAVEQWRRRYEALEARAEALRAEKRQPRDPPPALVQKHANEIAALEKRIAILQEEFSAFKETAEEVAEAKDAELERVLGVNASLRDEIRILQGQGTAADAQPEDGTHAQLPASPWGSSRRQLPPDDSRSFYSAGSMGASGSFANNLGFLSRREDLPSRGPQEDGWTQSEGRAPSDWGFGLESSGLQESNLLRLAEQQARREEELNAARQKAAGLEAEIADLSREVELRQEQETALKEALREVEREKARASLADKQRLDIEYLKNTVLKLYETGEAPALLPALSMLLHFSPAEVKRCQEALARQSESSEDGGAPRAGAATDGDGYLSGWASWAFGEGEPAPR